MHRNLLSLKLLRRKVHLIHSTAHLKRIRWTCKLTILLSVVLLTTLPACQSKPKTVSLALLGDIMPGRGVHLSKTSLAYIEADIKSADLALTNLESAITTHESISPEGYSLCAPPDSIPILAQSGLDIFAVENNHSFDCGSQGHDDTVNILENNNLVALTSEGYNTVIHNILLTFFAFDDISQPIDMEYAMQQIQTARESGALVIVSIHWGVEYQGGISNRQSAIAKALIASGATLIWGHHPHVIQPAEWIPAGCNDSSTGSDCGLVLYSLGNALFDQEGLSDTRRSALVTVTLDKQGNISTQVIPFIIDTFSSMVTEPDDTTSEIIISRLGLP
ncbi:MAG: CapA family protein [Anaerolineales bacterium]